MDYVRNLLDPLLSKFGGALPNIIGALLVLIIGFMIAKMVKKLIERLLRKTSIDERIAAKMNAPFRIDQFIAKLVYYLVVIYTLIIVLDLLGVESVLEPLQAMMTSFVAFIPKIIGAGIIGFAGYMIAKIASEATAFLSERLEGFGTKMGIKQGSFDLSNVVKQLVFVIVFVPILIIALDTLEMKAISEPATQLLSQMMDAIPMILAAVLLIAVFFIVGKYVVGIIVNLLSNLGVDGFSEKLGIAQYTGTMSISKVIGNVAMFFIMFAGIIAAAEKLELTQLQLIMNDVMHIAGKVFFGMIILLGGIFISNIAVSAIENSNKGSFLASVARFAILGVFLSFALHTMGIAESIVNLAFGLTLGAIAVAFALSFGLGGREAAGKQMQKFFDNLNKK